jgi:cytochrome c oxidase subunit 1
MTGTLQPPVTDPFDALPKTRGEQLRRLPERPLELTRSDGKLVLTHVIVAMLALLLGGVAGLLQSLQRSGRFDLPEWLGYYQLLTAHGILMAIVFTTVFILGFFYAGVALVTDGELYTAPRALAWAGFWTMILGAVLIVIPLFAGEATVLYTFYAPMQAHPAFYFGLVFFVVGSWLGGAAIFAQYAIWRRAYGAQTSPLFAFMAVATMILWQVATLGVAATVIGQMIPWSLGWVDGIDVLLSRTLFWFFGHPLVYFWLMPAYTAWYLVMPKLIGGRVFSDNLARLSFMLLIVFSVPVGLHHQLMEPGVDAGWKLFQVFLTFAVVIPSLVTAFSLFATMEQAGRARGHRGLFGWLKGLPWKDARFLALMMGMLVFIPGGAGGLILASFNLNQVAHNTIFVTGHFHLTVATAVALTFIGTAFWLVPHAAGRVITPRANRWMLAQVWTWVIGMTIMSTAQHIVGLMGAPRRTKRIDYGAGETVANSWEPYQMGMAIGGTVLFVSVILAFGIVLHLWLRAPRATAAMPRAEFPLADPPRTGLETPWWLERWRLWLAVLAVLVVAAYTGPVVDIFQQDGTGAKPVQPFKGSEGGNALPTATVASTSEPTVTTTAPAAAAAGTTVDVELGEDGAKLYVKPSVAEVDAGTVTFAVENVGAMPHELVVLKTDTPAGELPEGDGGKVKEEGRIAYVPSLTPGAPVNYLTMDLEPGAYVLLCNVPGHYGLGQYVAFTVS